MRKLTPFAALILLAGCGQGGEEPAAETPDAAPAEAAMPAEEPAETMSVEPAAEGDATPVAAAATTAAAAPAAYAQCKVCHSTEAGKNMIGPSLAGVFGAKAGHVGDFAYSPAMKDSGLTWDEATLNSYLEAPMKFVPGNKMAFAGIKDPAKRQEVIDYLKTL